jgi:hypothetical protein
MSHLLGIWHSSGGVSRNVDPFDSQLAVEGEEVEGLIRSACLEWMGSMFVVYWGVFSFRITPSID